MTRRTGGLFFSLISSFPLSVEGRGPGSLTSLTRSLICVHETTRKKDWSGNLQSQSQPEPWEIIWEGTLRIQKTTWEQRKEKGANASFNILTRKSRRRQASILDLHWKQKGWKDSPCPGRGRLFFPHDRYLLEKEIPWHIHPPISIMANNLSWCSPSWKRNGLMGTFARTRARCFSSQPTLETNSGIRALQIRIGMAYHHRAHAHETQGTESVKFLGCLSLYRIFLFAYVRFFPSPLIVTPALPDPISQRSEGQKKNLKASGLKKSCLHHQANSNRVRICCQMISSESKQKQKKKKWGVVNKNGRYLGLKKKNKKEF